MTTPHTTLDTILIPSTIHFGNLSIENFKRYVLQSRRCGIYPAITQETVDDLQNLISRYRTFDDFQDEYNGFADIEAKNLVSIYRALYNV